MTPRERFLATMTFGCADKVPFVPGVPRESTLTAWHAQGLAEGRDYNAAVCEAIGLPASAITPREEAPVDFRLLPRFEEKVLEHRDGHYLVQDWSGNVVEIADVYDATYLRSARDFVTRKWHSFPVSGPEDFAALKERYDPDAPERYPADFEALRRRWRGRRHVLRLHVNGPFEQLRHWCGFEPLCFLFVERPAFVDEMAAFWTAFVSRVMRRILEAGVVDFITISEDMAYKGKAMISPAMTRRFIQPAWIRWAREAGQAGVPVVEIDCDGHVGGLIPLWVESGVNACYPLEAAAGNDVNAYRRAFGRQMAFRGCVDKRSIAAGGAAIEAELGRLEPVVRDGGCLPTCDHGVPPDISWPNFVRYARLLAELTGWL